MYVNCFKEERGWKKKEERKELKSRNSRVRYLRQMRCGEWSLYGREENAPSGMSC